MWIAHGGGYSLTEISESENSSENTQNSGENVDNSGDSGNLSTNEEVSATSTSTTTDRTALTYDETNDYIYYEDGEYPQDVASITLEWNAGKSEVTASYDDNNKILTLDGTISSSTGVLLCELTDISLTEGDVFEITSERVGGEVSSLSGTVAFTTDICDSSFVDMESYGTRNYVDIAFAASDNASGELTINSTSEAYGTGVRIFIYVASGSTATFNNAQYRITITYSDILEDAYDDGDMTYEYSLDEGGYTATVYSNDVQVADAEAGTKFARIEVGGTVKWFAVEPIRWIVAYGESLPTTLTAVSEKVLSVGSYQSSTSYNLTYQSLYTATNTSSMINTSTGSLGWSVEDSVTYDTFNSSLSQTTVYSANLGNSTSSNTTITSGGYRVASAYEIEDIGGNYATESTAFVAFILSGGTSTTTADVDYWTRDLAYSFDADSNYGASIGDAAASFSGTLGNGVYVTKAGTLSNADFTNTFGARFSTLTTLALCTDDGEYLLEDYEVSSSLLDGNSNRTATLFTVDSTEWKVGQAIIITLDIEWVDLTFPDDFTEESTGGDVPSFCIQQSGDVTGFSSGDLNRIWIAFFGEGSVSYYHYYSETTYSSKIVAKSTYIDSWIENTYWTFGLRVNYITGGTITINSLDVTVI